MTRTLIAGMTLLMLFTTLAEARKSQNQPSTFTAAQQEVYTACMNAAKAKAGDGANKTPLMKQADVTCKAKAKG